MLRLSLSVLALILVACSQRIVTDLSDLNFTPHPTAQFEPQLGHIPYPHSSLMNPLTGKVSLPTPCHENGTAKALRTQILNELDGFGTFRSPITTNFTHPLDPASFSERVILMKMGENPTPIEFDISTAPTQKWSADCKDLVDSFALTLTPVQPLDDDSEYVVTLLKGITTTDQIEFVSSSSWSLIRQSSPPVRLHYPDEVSPPFVSHNKTPLNPSVPEDFDKLISLEQQWQTHQPMLIFLDTYLESFERRDLLLAWKFKTQTIRRVFDPQDPRSLVQRLAPISQTLVITETIKDDPATPDLNEVVSYIQEEFDTWYPLTENEPTPYTCDPLDTSLADVEFDKLAFACDSVGTIHKGHFFSPSYQFNTPEGDALTPGPWMHPVDPPQLGGITRVPFLAILPNTAPDKSSGYPVILFGHGINRSKEQLFRFGPTLVKEGFALIAFDWAKHGERAVQVNHDAASGCGEEHLFSRPTYANQHCYEVIISPILPDLRDTFRQSQLDAFQFKRSIDGCTSDPTCNASFQLDPQRQGFLGHSLGVLLSITPVSYWTDLKAALFSVGSSGWVDLILSTRGKKNYLCPIIDGLIAANFVEGETYHQAGDQASCISGAYLQQPAFWEFVATGRWILDPSDGGNFAPLLGERLQAPDNQTNVALVQVCDDELISSLATTNLGSQLLLSSPSCNKATNQSSSTAVSDLFSNPGSYWITYGPTDSSTFTHAALTSNSIFKDSHLGGEDTVSKTGEKGLNAVREYQNDVATFFKANLKDR